MNERVERSLLGSFLVLAHCLSVFHASAADGKTSAAFFEKSIRPIFTEYCLKCHSTEQQKGELDLERFSSLAEVKKHPKVWQSVIEQLANNEMPPKDKPQPAPAQREQLLTWIDAVLDEIAPPQADWSKPNEA